MKSTLGLLLPSGLAHHVDDHLVLLLRPLHGVHLLQHLPCHPYWLYVHLDDIHVLHLHPVFEHLVHRLVHS
jgi:hypothetical protein